MSLMNAVSVDEISRFQTGFPVGIFSGLSIDALKTIAAISNRHLFSKGEVIIHDGEEGDTMFLLLKGKVRVTKRLLVKGAKQLGEGDKEIVSLAATQHPYFGELALFDPNSLRTATVTAIEDCECGVLFNKDFLVLADANPQVGYPVMKNILQNLARTVRKQNENILNLTTALSFTLSAHG